MIHEMKLNDKAFNNIKSGIKNLNLGFMMTSEKI